MATYFCWSDRQNREQATSIEAETPVQAAERYASDVASLAASDVAAIAVSVAGAELGAEPFSFTVMVYPKAGG